MFYPQLCEMCIIAIIAIAWTSNKKIVTTKTKTFLFVLGACVVNAALDFTVRYYYYAYDSANRVYDLLIRGYLFSYTFVITSIFSYLRFGLINKMGKNMPILLTNFVTAVNLIFTLFLPMEVHLNGNSIHFEGMAVYYSCYYTLALLVISLIYVVSNRKYIDRLELAGSIVLITFLMAGGFSRYLDLNIEITGFLFGIGVFFLYLMIENPENYRDSETDLFLYDVFYEYIHGKMLTKEKTAIAYIYLKNNIEEDKKVIFEEIFKPTIKEFKLDQNSHVFRGNTDELIFVSDNLDKINELVDRYTKLINEHENFVRILGHSLSTILVIPNSNLVKNADEFSNIFQLMNVKNNQYKNYLTVDTYDATTAYQIQTEASILREIDYVIDNNKIDLQFSFIFDSKYNVVGIEISSKISKQNGGILNPAQYVPVAIKYSRIARMDDFTFDDVASFVNENILAKTVRHVLIKTSIMRFEDPTYADKLKNMLDKFGVDPSIICLELTNTEAISNKEIVIKTMKKINDTGMKIILGGFGRNESNLNYLVDLPVYGIKFHSSMLRSVSDNEQAKMILVNIIKVAHSIGLKTIMTGIYNQTDFELAKNLENDMLEGEFLSKKVDVNEYRKAFNFGKK